MTSSASAAKSGPNADLSEPPNRTFTRRSFLKTDRVAAAASLFIGPSISTASPSTQLRHASFGASGMAWSDITELTKYPEVRLVAVAEVDLNRTAQLKKKFPDVKIYQDWRQLLDKE